MKVYRKLVRDKIPEIIEADGKVPVTKKLDDAEFRKELNKKLLEEVREYIEDSNVEELERRSSKSYSWFTRISGFKPI